MRRSIKAIFVLLLTCGLMVGAILQLKRKLGKNPLRPR